jgi:hypothetical protein
MRAKHKAGDHKMAKGNLSRQSVGLRAVRFAVVPVLALLGGCADEIQLQGKIFDVVGLGANAQKSGDPKMAERAPLVLPPNNDRIPEPGTPAEAAATDVATLDDPDKKAVTSKAELEKQQAAYCKVHYEEARARGDDNADLAEGPLGPCRASVLSAIEKWNKGDDEK